MKKKVAAYFQPLVSVGPRHEPQASNHHVANAISAYNIEQWSNGYFSVNEDGNVVVLFDNKNPVELTAIAAQLAIHGSHFPVIIRFPHIIQHRVATLYDAFEKALSKYDYKNEYTLVYPIKVNQQRRVVEEVIYAQQQHGKGHPGLEVGSKPELMLALALAPKGSDIICNGYKDPQYIRLALLGQQLGHKVYLVIEKPCEADLILETAESLGLTPQLGVRVQLSSQAKSAWEMTSGEKAKFGLNASQLLEVIDYLQAQGSLAQLKLLHVHLGSQLVNISDIEVALKEFCRFYSELHKLGAPISCLDFGGGLAVDYEGTQSVSTYSMNYGVVDYADAIIKEVAETCRKQNLPEPQIITETGRALLSHHALLLTNVVDVHNPVETAIKPPAFDAPKLLHDLWQLYKTIPLKIDIDFINETVQQLAGKLGTLQQGYSVGDISLTQRAWAEHLSQWIYKLLYQNSRMIDSEDHPEILTALNRKIASQCHVNFSLFQSLPDSWGVDQVFPVLPIAGLNQPLTDRIVVSDMTCDSEGSLMQYISEKAVTTTLSLPVWPKQQPKLLAFFLMGAYQEILGSKHNLFGATCAVEARLTDENDLEIYHDSKGDSIADVLHTVNFHHEKIMDYVVRKLEDSDLAEQQQNSFKQQFQQSLYSPTYLQGL